MHLKQFRKLSHCTQRFRAGVKQSSAEPILPSHRHISAGNPFASDAAIPFHLETNAVQSLQEHDSSAAYRVCTEQESRPNKDQKQSKRNYMSLLGRDVIAERSCGNQREATGFNQSTACGFRKNDLTSSLFS